MNATSFITFFPCMLRQNALRCYKELYTAYHFETGPIHKENKLYLLRYSLLNDGHSIH